MDLYEDDYATFSNNAEYDEAFKVAAFFMGIAAAVVLAFTALAGLAAWFTSKAIKGRRK